MAIIPEAVPCRDVQDNDPAGVPSILLEEGVDSRALFRVRRRHRDRRDLLGLHAGGSSQVEMVIHRMHLTGIGCTGKRDMVKNVLVFQMMPDFNPRPGEDRDPQSAGTAVKVYEKILSPVPNGLHPSPEFHHTQAAGKDDNLILIKQMSEVNIYAVNRANCLPAGKDSN